MAWLNLSWLSLLSPLLASETGTAHGSSAWLDFTGKVVNFLILFGSLGYFLYRPIKQWLNNRTEFIAKLIEETTRMRKEAEDRLASFNQRLTQIAQEIEEMKRKAETEGLKEKERLLSLAREEAARIERLTALEIEALRRGAIKELKAYAATLSTALAEERIRKKLSPELHRQLIRRSIERLAKLHESLHTG
ncbi:MAG: ATP synthase F0 subunit B [Candidatus Aminicenantes bacterium]|nr:ATP synthase F0 subunit B [Candidatus Aminicenantes bacterium]